MTSGTSFEIAKSSASTRGGRRSSFSLYGAVRRARRKKNTDVLMTGQREQATDTDWRLRHGGRQRLGASPASRQHGRQDPSRRGPLDDGQVRQQERSGVQQRAGQSSGVCAGRSRSSGRPFWYVAAVFLIYALQSKGLCLCGCYYA
jgi:hypothetical protein